MLLRGSEVDDVVGKCEHSRIDDGLKLSQNFIYSCACVMWFASVPDLNACGESLTAVTLNCLKVGKPINDELRCEMAEDMWNSLLVDVAMQMLCEDC